MWGLYSQLICSLEAAHIIVRKFTSCNIADGLFVIRHVEHTLAGWLTLYLTEGVMEAIARIWLYQHTFILGFMSTCSMHKALWLGAISFVWTLLWDLLNTWVFSSMLLNLMKFAYSAFGLFSLAFSSFDFLTFAVSALGIAWLRISEWAEVAEFYALAVLEICLNFTLLGFRKMLAYLIKHISNQLLMILWDVLTCIEWGQSCSMTNSLEHLQTLQSIQLFL